MNSIFSENLKKLRKQLGLTQSEFAQELNKFALECGLATDGVEMFGKGKKKIFNLENDKQEPSLSDIKIICKYFNISPHNLIDEDKSEIIEVLKKIHFNTKMDFYFLPVFTIKERDLKFYEAYEQHVNILKQQEIDERLLKKCLTSYIISWEDKFQRIEAIANYLSLLLFNCIYNLGKTYLDNELVKFDNINDFFGKDVEHSVLKNKNDYRNNPYIEYYVDLLRKKGFSEFAEFFIAVSYLVGFVGNNDNFLINRDFAFNYLELLLFQDNRYAMLFCLVLANYYVCEEQEVISIEDVDEFINILIEEFKQEGILFIK